VPYDGEIGCIEPAVKVPLYPVPSAVIEPHVEPVFAESMYSILVSKNTTAMLVALVALEISRAALLTTFPPESMAVSVHEPAP
jgi:hypothetical protein